MTCGSFTTRKIDLVVDTLWLTKPTCIVGDVVLWWVHSLKQHRLTALAGCMKWVLEFDTCALDHHLISTGPLTMWLRRVTWRFKGKFSIFSLRYTVTYQAAWKFTSRAGWSSGFRGAPLRWLDLEKKKKTCLHNPASADWSLFCAACAVNYYFLSTTI